MFDYERKEHIEYLDNLVKEGSYQDYKNALKDLKNLSVKLKSKDFNVKIVVDQVDNICYGDIIFIISNTKTLYSEAKRIIEALKELKVDCDSSCLYFNVPLSGFMYTAIAIKADNSPDWYSEEERIIIR